MTPRLSNGGNSIATVKNAIKDAANKTASAVNKTP